MCLTSAEKGRITSPELLATNFLMLSSSLLVFFAARVLAHGQLVVRPQVLFCKAPFHLVRPKPVQLHGIIPPQMKDLVFPFFELIWFLLDYFSNLSQF